MQVKSDPPEASGPNTIQENDLPQGRSEQGEIRNGRIKATLVQFDARQHPLLL